MSNSQFRKGVNRWIGRTLAGAALVVAVTGGAQAVSITVSSAADAGANTFRAAVIAANGNPAIDTIRFLPNLFVTLSSDVVYDGPQDLTLLGRGSTIDGDGSKDATWDGGLFVSRSAADIKILNLTFSDSFNNGVGVFLPANATGVTSVTLHDVTIERSRFHGLYIDGQLTTGYNTDDVLQLACVDPWAFDSNASVMLNVLSSDILGNGTVIHEGPGQDFDASIATGCPVDFDGIRVDEGGIGGINGNLWFCRIDGNRADGVEYDERGDGGVLATTVHVSVADNGDTGTVDTDDGFDIDETGPGDIWAAFERVSVLGNFDEGLDFTEGDAGNLRAIVLDSDASANEDEGIKVEEGGDGHLALVIERSKVNDCASQQGIEATELGTGNLCFEIERSEVLRNDNDGINLVEEEAGNLTAEIERTRVMLNGDVGVVAEQELPGVGSLLAVNSDLTGNLDPSSLELDNVTPTLVATPTNP